jgi:short-subunit dehydrogenase involved in D-alanine esterification of teichoic acids
MKVVITGHTNGIGQCLFNTFKEYHHDVIGYSRSNGYDIENANDRKKIVEQSVDADVFINNAYSANGQTLLLEEMISTWEHFNKKIINVSSKLSYFPVGKDILYDNYILEKQKQNNIIESRLFVSTPQILNVVVGLVDTTMSSIFSSKKLNPAGLATLIYELTSKDEFYVQQIVLDVPNQDWKNIQRG